MPESDNHPADWRSDDWARGLVAIFLIAYLIHAFSVVSTHRHLYGDASWFLVRIISDGAVTEFFQHFLREFYFSRYFAFWLTQFPTVAAIKLGVSDPEKLSFIFGSSFVFWKLASVLTSLWLLPRGRKHFVIFPILGILAGTINSEIYLVTETHISSAAFWPLLIAFVWLPDKLTWTRTICLAIAIVVTSFLYESMALLLLVPLAVLGLKLATGRPDAATRKKMYLLATLLVLGSAMNVAAIAFPRDPANKAGFLGGVIALVHDTFRGYPYLHAGPTASVTCVVLLVMVFAVPGADARVMAGLGSAVLACWPAFHFIAFRGSLNYSVAEADRGFSGGAMQVALVVLFFAALRFRPAFERQRATSALLLVVGLLLGQLSWQFLATKSWVDTTSLVRHALATRTGLLNCSRVSEEYGKAASPSVDRVLCGWWVTPLSIILAPDRKIRALLISPELIPFDVLDAKALPTMRFAPVDYDPYIHQLSRPQELVRGDTIGFTRKGNGWLITRTGFSRPEDWGTWAVGRTASLELCVAQKARDGLNEVRLRFKLGAFVPPTRPRLDVQIFADGGKVGDWSFANPETTAERDLEVPSDLFKNGCVTLEFRMSDVASPASLGLSGDSRQLGIALIELKVAS